MSKFEVFVDHNNDLDKIQQTLTAFEKVGFVMASDFSKKIPTAKELYKEFRKYNHGNSKIILHLYHNSITGKDEISYGTKKSFQSYPQYKNIYILKV